MERRFSAERATDLRVDGGENRPDTIVGYGAVFYAGTPETEYWLWDDMVERILPGAFDRALREDDVRGLFNHDPNIVLGRTSAGTMRLSVDGKGLLYRIEAPPTGVGADVVQSIKRGDVQGSSFSVDVLAQTWRKIEEDGKPTIYVREVVEVRLYDAGPVTFPAYTGTSAGVPAAEGEQQAAKRPWAEAAGAALARDGLSAAREAFEAFQTRLERRERASRAVAVETYEEPFRYEH